MKKLIFFLLISPFTHSQTSPELSLLGGYEYSSINSTGWNVLFTAVSPTEKYPRLAYGFSLGYGISEYNGDAHNPEVNPAEYSLETYEAKHVIYGRRERMRTGLEAQYAVIDRERSRLFVGTGLTLEILRSNREYGRYLIGEVDSTGFVVTEIPYSFDVKGKDIETNSVLLVQPFLAYQYGLTSNLFLHARVMGNIPIRFGSYPVPGPQLNLGVMYRL